MRKTYDIILYRTETLRLPLEVQAVNEQHAAECVDAEEWHAVA